jgi:hypothetical protein
LVLTFVLPYEGTFVATYVYVYRNKQSIICMILPEIFSFIQGVSKFEPREYAEVVGWIAYSMAICDEKARIAGSNQKNLVGLQRTVRVPCTCTRRAKVFFYLRRYFRIILGAR